MILKYEPASEPLHISGWGGHRHAELMFFLGVLALERLEGMVLHGELRFQGPYFLLHPGLLLLQSVTEGCQQRASVCVCVCEREREREREREASSASRALAFSCTPD